jgi:hypothetical protein
MLKCDDMEEVLEKIKGKSSEGKDPVSRLYSLINLWNIAGRNTYVIGKEFAKALKDVMIPPRAFMFNEPAFEILFPASLGLKIEGNDRAFSSAIVVCDHLRRGIAISAFDDDKKEMLHAHFFIPCVSAIIDPKHMELILFLLNCIQYILSANPTIDRLERPPVPDNLKRRARDRFAQEHADLPYFPVQLVSWGWMRPRSFSVDETTVKGHFRWQRCGESLKDVRLVWINEHIRKYNENETISSSKNGD